MNRFAYILLLAVVMLFHAKARADCSQFAPGFLPCPPVAYQAFVIRLIVPSGVGGHPGNTSVGLPHVAVNGNVIAIRADAATSPNTSTLIPPLLVPIDPLPPGHYTLIFTTDNFFCSFDCQPEGSTVLVDQGFDVVPGPSIAVPTLSDATIVLLLVAILGIAALKLYGFEGRAEK